MLSAAPCRAEASPAPAEQAAPSRQEGLLLVAFGTSHQDATVSYKELEKDMLAHYAPDRLKWSYTSSIIRRKLAGRGTPVPSVEENLEQMARKGIRTLRVQSLHIAPGEEFSRMERQIVSFLARHPDSFDHVFIGRWKANGTGTRPSRPFWSISPRNGRRMKPSCSWGTASRKDAATWCFPTSPAS